MYEQIEKVYLLYYHDLYWFLLKQCPDSNIVDDVIQSTFLEALKSLESYRGQASMKTWLFSIARHQLFRQLRSKHHTQLDISDLPEAVFMTNEDMSDHVVAQQIMITIDALPPPHHEIMRLRLLHGLSFKEIGVQVGQTENYCRVNFYRMKEKLRKEYDDEQM